MFGIILTSITTFMHVYVFSRAATVPYIDRHVSRIVLIAIAIALWLIFLLGRFIGHDGKGIGALILEFLAMNWLAAIFLFFICMLFIDIVTLFGLILPRISPILRGYALAVGLILSSVALVQGMRPPVVDKYEVFLQGLPDAADGTVVAALSDTHLGLQLGPRWLQARIDQIDALQPDIVVLLGDIFEGHGAEEAPLISTFRRLKAPLGVWAVPGNHEYHGSGRMGLFEKAGFHLMRNRSVQVIPGLVIAGVDDLTSARRRNMKTDYVTQALKNRPPGVTILLSHTPWQVEASAEAGVDLMLCGHTHGGQIWPFDYLVQSMYPYLEGRYTIGTMTLIVCRGTGTWGPRMRLWQPGQILHITLRSGRETE